jgi:hypothetical protein
MIDHDWVTAPIGIDADRWVSRPGCRALLIVVHTLASCHRLLDLADLAEPDTRVQAVFTVAPDVFNADVEPHLRSLGALVVPWQQAIRERFDLALAAAHGGLHQVHAPVVLLAHGAGHGKTVVPPGHGGPPAAEPTVYGLDAARLVRDGRVLASALILSHESEREVLSRQCPDALPLSVVAGDICYDRLVASLPARGVYRRALGIGVRQKLVVVSSTWGADGLFGEVPDLLPTLMEQLPPERYRVAALLHPAVWGAHGRRQITAWTRDCRDAGMILPDPTDDWRSYVAAADILVGDRGSVTAYGAAVGLPVLCLSTTATGRTARLSPQALVLASADRLDVARPVRPQLRAARPVDHRRVAAAITSRPGRAARLMQTKMYELMGLPEPGRHREAAPVAPPRETAP